MGSAFGILNKSKKDAWYVLRSSDNTGMVIKLSPDENRIVRLSDNEIVTAITYDSKEEAEASVGIGEKYKFYPSGVK